MELTEQQYGQLEEALLDAFRTQARLKRMLRIGLGKNLNAITTGNGLQEIVSDLIDASQEKRWTAELIVAARQANPGNPKLLAFAQQVGLAVTMPTEKELEELRKAVPTQDTEEWLVLEALIKGSAPMQDVAKLVERSKQVCRIEITRNGNHLFGTGFLLGPDVVMTNFHVMESVISGQTNPNDIILRFDHKEVDGKIISQGQVYRLAKENWRIDFSPMSPFDKEPEPKNGVPKPDELDYVLLRIDGQPGYEPIGQNPDPKASKRGWIEVPTQQPHLLPNNLLYILQHPKGGPIKLGIGQIGNLNQNKTRLTYKTNTEGGSSGSPCFNTNWELVGLHHATDPQVVNKRPPAYNQGIPFTAILKLLEKRGLKGVLGGTFRPPPPRRPDLRILQKMAEDTYLISGNGFQSYDVGDDLVVYYAMGVGAILPIGLLRVTAKNPDNLQAQAILIHPEHKIIPNLSVRQRTNQFRTSDLIPAYQEAAGYFLREGRVVLRPDIQVEAGSIIEAVEPVVYDGKVMAYDYFTSPIQMRINRVGPDGKIAQVQLITGQWPQTGIIIIIVPIPVVTIPPLVSHPTQPQNLM